MVHVEHRREFLGLLRSLVSGRITNHEFELSLFNTDDKLIHQLEELIWCTYDDYKEHKLEPETLSPEGRKLIERSILFLSSDLEFGWPKYPSRRLWVYSWLTFGFFRYHYRERIRAFHDYGEEDFWPFRSEEELKKEAKKPRVGLSLKYAS